MLLVNLNFIRTAFSQKETQKRTRTGLGRFFVGLTIIVLIVLGANASAQESFIEAFGIGLSSCATWLDEPGTRHSGDNWVLGFWTGMNVQANLKVGETTDARGILGEVEVRCRQRPSGALATAAKQTWLDMRKEGR